MKLSLWRRLILLSAGLGLAALAQAGPYSGIYVFGDSLSDVGNDALITSGAIPLSTVYTNGTDAGRFTNGLNYADRLAAGLGLSLTPSATPVIGGNDYAWGGALTNGIALPGSLSFNQQIAAFDSDHALADPNALYVLWIGANDMSAAFANHTSVGAAISTATSGVASAIQNLASRGATHFLIPNLPDLSLTPQVNQAPDATKLAVQGASVAFNMALESTLAQPGFAALSIRRLDVFSLQTAITDNPAAYGFSNVTDACYAGNVDGSPRNGSAAICGAPGSFVYWDYEHPTDALHALLGAQALAAAVPEASSWMLLAIGLAALGVGLRRQHRRS